MDNLDWEMVSALAQIAAAVATFAAVLVSLWLGVWQRRPRLRLRVTPAALVGDGWAHDFISFEVANRGERVAKIVGYGWRTGWLKRHHMVINHSQWHPHQPQLPYVLAPGDKDARDVLSERVEGLLAVLEAPLLLKAGELPASVGARFLAGAFPVEGRPNAAGSGFPRPAHQPS